MRSIGWRGVMRFDRARACAGVARVLLVLAVGSSGLVLAPVAGATAASYTWTGDFSGPGWSAPKNWEGEMVPSSSEPAALEFPHLAGCISSTCYKSENNLSGLSVESIKLDNGDEYDLSGDEITLGGDGLIAAPASGSSGPAGDLVELPIHLSAPQTWSIAGRSGGGLGENGVAVMGKLTGSTSALTLEIGKEAAVYLENETEVGPIAIDGANAGNAGVLNGFVSFFGDLNASDGSLVSLSHIFFIGSGEVGALRTNDAELAVGNGNYPAEGIEADSAIFDRASEVTFQITHAGTSAGTDYSQLVSTGAIELGGSSLEVRVGPPSEGQPCPALSPGQEFTLISTTGTLSGAFGNALEGSEIPIEFAKACTKESQTMQISYSESGGTQTVIGTVEAAKKKEEEAAVKKTQEEEAATSKRQEEAAAAKQHEEEVATTKKHEEAAAAAAVALAKHHQEEEAAAVVKKRQEEEVVAAAKKKEAEAAKAESKPLTRTQKLAKALEQCKKQPKKRRAVCAIKAKRQYGKARPKKHKGGRTT
jgi:hypothetical protein